jgi:hypothetical protein
MYGHAPGARGVWVVVDLPDALVHYPPPRTALMEKLAKAPSGCFPPSKDGPDAIPMLKQVGIPGGGG